MFKSNRKIFLGIFILLLTMFFISCGGGKKAEVVNTGTGGQTEETEETTTQELKTYENKIYNYSFQYPEGTELVDILADSPQGPTFPFVSALEIRGASNLNSKFAGINVVIQEEGVTPEDIAKQIHSTSSSKAPESLIFTKIQINDHSALEVSDVYTHHLDVYIPYNGKIYIVILINWDGNRNSQDYEFFQTILNSLKIEE